MLKSKFEQHGIVRELLLDDKEVKILTYSLQEDNLKGGGLDRTVFKVNYITRSDFESGGRRILEINTDEGNIVVISINLCNKIVTVPCSAAITYSYVAGELFVKVTNGEKQIIYDEQANILASETKFDIEVIFGGCGPLIKKTSKETGEEYRITFEGNIAC